LPRRSRIFGAFAAGKSLFATHVTSQEIPFAGRILHKNTYFTPRGLDITDQLAVSMGKEQDYYINALNYLSICNGAVVESQLYNNATNTRCTIAPNKRAFAKDAATIDDELIGVKHTPVDTLIQGRKCKKPIISNSYSETIYYYDPTVWVAVAPFEKHRYGNSATILKETGGALPIRRVYKSTAFTMISEAVAIEPMELGEDIFVLPEGVVVGN